MGWIAGIVWLTVLWQGAAFIYPYSHGLGLTASVHVNVWIWFFALDFLVLVVHEMGHALATWAVGYRLKVICAGPVTIRRGARGRRIAFDWRRVLSGGGFVGAIPSSNKDLRGNAMLIVFAGPFLTLNCAALLFLALINLPGTRLARWWEPVALGSVLFIASFFRNLTPVGTSDGNRLLQLMQRSRGGEEFLNLFGASIDEEQAEESRASVDLDDEVASRARVVDQLKAGKGHDRLPLAVAYQNLGIAQFHASDVSEAETSLNAALKIFQQCRDVHPALEGNVWSVLCHIHRERHQLEAVQTDYAHALDAFDRAEKKGGVDPVQRRLVVASLHMHAGHPDLALVEIAEGFAALPAGPKSAMNRATLLRLQAEADFATGLPLRGLAAASEAAGLLRSPELLENEGRRAVAQLVALGGALWKGGQSDEGILLTSEAIAWMEQHGSERLAARCRVGLAAKLRKAGRLDEADAALPEETDLPANQWAGFFAVRGQIRLARLRFDEAMDDFARGVQLRSAGVRPSPVTLALDKSGLAEALLGCGRVTDAERQALDALEVLLPAGHPDASEALITLALIGWQRGEDGADAQFEQAIRCIVDAPLLEPAVKARTLEEEEQRLRYYGRVNEATRADAEARGQWQALAAGENLVAQAEQPVSS